jgi:multidrug efflux pump subunit AcrA (membrane-fusion protein)
MRRLLKWLLILGIPLGGVAALGMYGMAYLKAKAVPRYTEGEVTKGRIETVVNSTGPVKPVRSLTVGSFISGPIAEIRVDFNAKVQEGELLARIDPRLQRAALDRENAALATHNCNRPAIMKIEP